MTEQEAIKEIRSCLGVNKSIMPYSDEMEAFGMAIKALKFQEEFKSRLEKMDIDFEDLLKKYNQVVDDAKLEYAERVQKCIERIENECDSPDIGEHGTMLLALNIINEELGCEE